MIKSTGYSDRSIARRGARAVYRSGLENRRGASHREFESHPLRHFFTILIFIARFRLIIYKEYLIFCARSSTGQSIGLRIRRLGVRIPPGVPGFNIYD